MEPRIRELLAPFGVDCVGVCRFADCLPLLSCRAASRVPEGARSVIVCLFPYHIGPAGEHPRRNVARYAVPDDYHTVVGGILGHLAETLAREHPGEAFVPFVDNSPIREVAAGALAGLGVVGLHGQLLNPRYGGRVFIGEVVSTAELPPSTPNPGACLGCGRCFAACPTGAIAPGRPLERSRCRSAITQKKGALTGWEQEQVRAGGLAWGCDLCVDACPMNTDRLSPVTAFYRAPLPVLTGPGLESALVAKAYGYRGRAVLDRNLALLPVE